MSQIEDVFGINIIQCIDSCCFIYGFKKEDKEFLVNSIREMISSGCSIDDVLAYNWPDKFFSDFISLINKHVIFHIKTIGRLRANQFFSLTKRNGLEYCISRLVYAVRTNTPVGDITVKMNTSNPNPNKSSFFVGTNKPNKGATGVPYLEAKRQLWIRRDLRQMMFGVLPKKKKKQ